MKKILLYSIVAIGLGIATGWLVNAYRFRGVQERFVPYKEVEMPAELLPPPGFEG